MAVKRCSYQVTDYVVYLKILYRDDEFEYDLEDIMVMEAIWLSVRVIYSVTKLSSSITL